MVEYGTCTEVRVRDEGRGEPPWKSSTSETRILEIRKKVCDAVENHLQLAKDPGMVEKIKIVDYSCVEYYYYYNYYYQ